MPKKDWRNAKLRPRKPWDRLQNESMSAWEAFINYRDLGLKRSRERVIRRLLETGDTRTLGSLRVLCARWAKDFKWNERVEKWDRYLDRRHLRNAKLKRERMAERLARHSVEMQEVFREPVLEALRRKRSEREKLRIEMKSMTYSELMSVIEKNGKIWKSLTDVERLALGDVDSRIAIQGESILEQNKIVDEVIRKYPKARRLWNRLSRLLTKYIMIEQKKKKRREVQGEDVEDE